MNSVGSGSSGGGGAVGTMSGGRNSMGSSGGSMESRGGITPSAFSSRGLASYKPGMESRSSSPMINIKNGLEANSKSARSESLAFRADGAKPMIDLKQGKAEFKNPTVRLEKKSQASPMVNIHNGLESNSKFARSESLQFKSEEAKPIFDLKQGKIEFKNSMVRFEKKAQSSPIINTKNGLESNSKFARSESLQFKSEGAKPLIDLKQSKVEFRNPMVRFEKNVHGLPTKENNLVPNKIAQPSFEKQKPASEHQVTQSEVKQINERIIKSRSEISGYKFDAQKTWAKRAEIKQAAMQALRTNNEPLIKTYARPAEKTRVQTVSKPKIESAMRSRIELAVKNAVNKLTKQDIKQNIPEISEAKINTALMPRIEAVAEVKTQILAQTDQITNEITTQSVRSEPNVSTAVSTRIEAAARTQPSMQTAVKERISPTTLPKTEAEIKIQSLTSTKVQVESATLPKTLTETSPLTATEVTTKAKTLNEAKVNEQLGTQGNAVIVEEVDPSAKESGEKEVEERKNKQRFAYFEVDASTNRKRDKILKTAYNMARMRIKAFFGQDKIPTGKDIAPYLEPINNLQTESKSIEGIDQDGSAQKYIEYFAQQGEIVDINKMASVAENNFTATNLTLTPSDKIVGKKEAYTVHKATEFPAKMDGKLVKVKLNENLVEAA